MPERVLEVCRLGLISYETALNIQKETESAIIARQKNDTLFLLEHPHTYTLGRRAKMDGVLATTEILKTLGATVFETNRGGKVTYHGLGQLVGYPIINLSLFKEDVHLYVRNLEEVLIRTMTDFAVESFRIKDLTGVHTSDGKVAAIGVHIKRWVTTHGFALNVNTDLSYFDWIIACEGEPVTSLEKLLGREVPFAEVEAKIIKNFAEVFEYAEVIETANLQAVAI
jgi:lipoyl(octanoyl) transferase